MRDRIIFIIVAIVAVVIGVLVFLYGNIGNGSSMDATSSRAEYTPPSAVSVPFTKLVQGAKSDIVERVNYLITSPVELSELWKLIDATGPPPTIDFKTQMVIAVFAGKESTYSIEVSNIEDTDSRMVSIAIAKPDGICTKFATSTYEIVMVPITSLQFTHKDIQTTASCPNKLL